MKPRLAISFSGGASSAVMTRMLLESHSETHEIMITFCNTGWEHEETLRFVRDADRHWFGGRVEWIEAVMHEHGTAPSARLVTYETASRNEEPFEEYIAKHGIPCVSHPHCTSRLKEDPMRWWRRHNGWDPGSYDTAIGIRADEVDRMSSSSQEKRLVYPLVKAGIRECDVNEIGRRFDWWLNLPSDAWGNCKGCFKKSLRKLMTLAVDAPESFDFPERMEKKYPNGRRFYREHRTVADIKELAKKPFEKYTKKRDSGMLFDVIDIGSGCGESCEIGADD